MKLITKILAFSAVAAMAGCAEGDSRPVTRTQVVGHYALVVHANYTDALADANALSAAIDAFVSAPSAETQASAKAAWLKSRDSYGQTEAFRFSGGPIDAEGGPEGQLNAWPLDEVYVDYVEGDADAGIINKTDIEITKAKLSALNEGGEDDILGIGAAFDAEKAIAAGYHAIEFLLWGQDLSLETAGTRSWKDYLTTADATAPNGDRRGTYLKAAVGLLVDDLTTMVTAWDPETEGNFVNATFLPQDPDTSLKNIITGIGIMAKGELAGERIDVALDTHDQEDEHSCFSDNTHKDILGNAKGIQNVYMGTYGDLKGPGIADLVAHQDASLATEVETLLNEAVAGATNLPTPFDALIADPESDGWQQADALVKKLGQVGDSFVKAAEKLGLGIISVELPE